MVLVPVVDAKAVQRACEIIGHSADLVADAPGNWFLRVTEDEADLLADMVQA